MEVIQALCAAYNISKDEVLAVQNQKQSERGGFEERIFIMKVAHQQGSFYEKYYRKDPAKYPETQEEW